MTRSEPQSRRHHRGENHHSRSDREAPRSERAKAGQHAQLGGTLLLQLFELEREVLALARLHHADRERPDPD